MAVSGKVEKRHYHRHMSNMEAASGGIKATIYSLLI